MFYIRIDKQNNTIVSISYEPIVETEFEYGVFVDQEVTQFCQQNPHITSGACYYINNEIVYREADHQKIQLQGQQHLIRNKREEECFPYINRGQLWYAKLTNEQLQELSKWYESWLNAPATLNIPPKPEWLE